MDELEHGDIAPLLDRLGRASTPPVNETAHDIDLGDITGAYRPLQSHRSIALRRLAFIGRPKLRSLLRQQYSLLCLMPYQTQSQIDSYTCDDLVIDLAAFHHGPWSGAHFAPRSELMNELTELIETMREQGGIVYVVRYADKALPGTMALERKSSIVVPRDSTPASLEQSPPSALLTQLRTFFEQERSAS